MLRSFLTASILPGCSVRTRRIPIAADELSTLLDMPTTGAFVERGVTQGG